MTDMPRAPKIFFGWWTVLACSVIGFLGVGVAGSGLSVLFKPIAAELGLSRAAASMAAGVQSLGLGVSGLTAGRAADRYGPRRTMLIGIAFLIFGLMAMYFVRSLWSFLIVWGLLVGLGYSFGCTFVTDTAIVRWFVRKSGLAINTKFAIQSLSGLLLLPVMAWLTTSHGWRFTCIAAGAAVALVCVPLAWFLVRPHRPESYGLKPDGAPEAKGDTEPEKVIDRAVGRQGEAEAADFTLKQAMGSPVYWLMILIAYLSGAAAPIMTVHCIPFLTDIGIDPVRAAGIMAIVLTSSIPARLITGFLLDRVKTVNLRFMIAIGFLVQAIGVTTFLLTRSVTMIYVWFFLFGVGSGITQSVQIPLWARYFGRKAYGTILGSSMAANVPVALVAPVYIGWVYDRSGSYMSIIVALAALTALSGVVALFILPPRPAVSAARATV